jgi:hypothetical protein
VGDYSFGFQAQEKDKEMWGGSVTYKYRVEDPRLGRFFAVDPLYSEYPWNSNYAFSENRLVDAVELEGLECVLVYQINPMIEDGRINVVHTAEGICVEYKEKSINVCISNDGPNESRIRPIWWDPRTWVWMPIYWEAKSRMRQIEELAEISEHDFLTSIPNYNAKWDLAGVGNTFRHCFSVVISTWLSGESGTKYIFDGHERREDRPENPLPQPLDDRYNDFICDLINNAVSTDYGLDLREEFKCGQDITKETILNLMNSIVWISMEQYYNDPNFNTETGEYHVNSWSYFSIDDKIVDDVYNFVKKALPQVK